MNFRASGLGVGSVWMKRVRRKVVMRGLEGWRGREGRFSGVIGGDDGVVKRRFGVWRIDIDDIVVRRERCRRRGFERDLEAIVSALSVVFLKVGRFSCCGIST